MRGSPADWSRDDCSTARVASRQTAVVVTSNSTPLGHRVILFSSLPATDRTQYQPRSIYRSVSWQMERGITYSSKALAKPLARRKGMTERRGDASLSVTTWASSQQRPPSNCLFSKSFSLAAESPLCAASSLLFAALMMFAPETAE